ncbi:MAG: 2-hydroxyacyl-CoA dehydratase [Desulfobacterales bacterium]|nr:2-hydroxyacyl-CoA dehydratase [Desulfobacteraceae bacterium]MBT7697070.1 2-hydroxyacyl-CoA dehydratase [Desulfobacterales bacterium]
MAFYKELLTLCAFEEDEIADQKQRIERTFEILGLGPEDMERAIERINKFYAVELLGVRKALGIWFKELFDLVLAKEEGKNVIYFGYPPPLLIGYIIKYATKPGNDYYVGCPEAVLCQVLGQLFDKLNPVLEAGEALGFPPGHGMCSMLQNRNGALDMGILPVPDLAIGVSYYCDMGPKADELMSHRHGNDVEYLDNSMDSPWGTWPDYDPEKIKFMAAQINKLFKSLKNKFGIEITDEVYEKGNESIMQYFMAVYGLNHHISADPCPLSLADAQLILNLGVGSTGVTIDEGFEAVQILTKEVEKRVEEGYGVVPKGAPRVLIYLPSFVDPAFNNLLNEVGLAVPITAALLPPPETPPPYPFTTIAEKIAERMMYSGVFHSAYGAIKFFAEGLKSTKVDGVIFNYQHNCRPCVCRSKLSKDYLDKETGLPMLLLEMDFYDNRNYSASSLQTRLEAFAEMLLAKKAEANKGIV